MHKSLCSQKAFKKRSFISSKGPANVWKEKNFFVIIDNEIENYSRAIYLSILRFEAFLLSFSRNPILKNKVKRLRFLTSAEMNAPIINVFECVPPALIQLS